jgi:hypothetical protein
MTLSDIAGWRLINQQIAGTTCNRPFETVSSLCALQAQDYLGVLWSIGLRSRACTEADIEQAIADRTIVRTWPMRGTLHFVSAADMHWMLELLTPPVIAASRRRQEQLELDDKTLARCRILISNALQGGRKLDRPAIYSLLEDQRVSTGGQRGYHILWRLAQEGLICFAAREGRQPTFALLEEWIGSAKRLDREAALATLAKRYFAGHGPATVQDFAWWSGLNLSDARVGLEMIASTLRQETDGTNVYWLNSEQTIAVAETGAAYLLPGFDEYLLGYNNRQAAIDPKYAQKLIPDNNGRFLPTMVLKGRVIGTWRHTLTKKAVRITLEPFALLTKAGRQAFTLAAERYGKFLGLPVEAGQS